MSTSTSFRILLVEDKEPNVRHVKDMLAGHEVTVVGSYDQAHNLLRARLNPDKARVALGAVKLPDGCELGELDFASNPDRVSIVILWAETGKRVFLGEVVEDRKDEFEKAFKRCRETINSSYEVPFDVVLTDVMFPKGGDECMNPKGSALARDQGEMPYGPVVALRALSVGVKKVGILTQGDHHSDPLVFAFDNLPGFQAGDVKVVCRNRMDTVLFDKTGQRVDRQAYMESDEGAALRAQDRLLAAGELIAVKDWATLLEQVMS